MHPGTEAPEHETEPGETEGAAYGHALLDRIGAGASSPADLANLMQFLNAGSLLHGACAVIFAALSSVAGSGAKR